MEMLSEKTADNAADVRGGEAPVVDVDVFAVAQRGDDRGVGRGPADAVLFEGLDQRSLGIARRRLGEMLLRVKRRQPHRIAHLHGRQHVVAVVLDGVVASFLVDGDVARLDQGGAVGAQQVARRSVAAREHVDRHGVEHCVRHLAGDRALPDERVEFELVGVEEPLDVRRHDGRRSRAHGFVRFLGVLRLGAVDAHLFGDRLLAVQALDGGANLGDRLGSQRHRIGAHVGNKADAAFADVDAFVQLLRRAHGALRGKTQLARGFLLQRRSRKWRRRIAAALLAVDGEHLERRGRAAGAAQRRLGGARSGFAGEAELLDLAAGKLHQLERKGLFAVLTLGVDGPVFLRDERGDLVLAFADHAQRRALHAPRGQAAPHLFPQQRREIEAHQVVERAARLLCVHQVERQLARMIDRFADRVLGDLVEHHALRGLALEFAALLEDLMQVPGDRLALAIGVGRQHQHRRFLQRLGNGGDVLLVALDQPILHREFVVGIDRAFLGHQVAHVTVGGQDLVVLAQVFLDRARFGGRFDDDEIFSHAAA